MPSLRVMCAVIASNVCRHCITKDTYGVAHISITKDIVSRTITKDIVSRTITKDIVSRKTRMGWLRLVGSLKLFVSLENMGLFCGADWKETYNFKEPTHCSRPIQWGIHTHTYTHTGSYQRNIRWEKFKKKVGGEIKTMSIWWLRLVGSLKS